MGNNTGRSNGCRTCLRRRVKCDQSRPICTRCSKGGFNCLGYRGALFIDEGWQVQQQRHRGPVLQPKRIHPSDKNKEHLPSLDIVENSVDSLNKCWSYRGSHAWSSLSASPWKDDIFVSYLIADFGPMGAIYRNLVAPNYHPDSPQRSAGKQSFLALATTFFGVGHAQESLVNDGRRLYSRALQMVNAAIGDTDHLIIKEALSSVAALCLHEAISPTLTTSHSWLHHICGLEQLFSLHGPISETSDPLHKVLLAVTRPIMVVAALYARRPSLMAQPEWSAAATYTPHNDTPFPFNSALPYFLDALAQIPAMYSERDAIVSHLHTGGAESPADNDGTSDSPSPARSLIDRSLSLLQDIRSRRMQWKASHPESEFQSLSQTHISSTQPCPCTITTHFSSLPVANAFTFYNALVILINQFIISMYQLLPVDDRQILAEGQASEQVLVAATEILRSMDYHLPYTAPTTTTQIDGSGPRNFYLIFPMRIAYQALSRSSLPQAVPLKLWLKDVFYIIKGRAGPWASNEKIFAID